MTITLKTLKQTVMNIKTKMQTAHRDNKKKIQKKTFAISIKGFNKKRKYTS